MVLSLVTFMTTFLAYGQNVSPNNMWGHFGLRNGTFNSPQGIAIDPSGNVYVADTNNNRIQKFTDNGTFITKWGQFRIIEMVHLILLKV